MINVKEPPYNALGNAIYTDGIGNFFQDQSLLIPGVDDSWAIQQAINDASGMNRQSTRIGEEVYIPAGTYLINQTIVITKTVIMYGASGLAGSDALGKHDQKKPTTLVISENQNGILLTKVSIGMWAEDNITVWQPIIDDKPEGSIIKNIEVQSKYFHPAPEDRTIVDPDEKPEPALQIGIQIDGTGFIKLENLAINKIDGNAIHINSGESIVNDVNIQALAQLYTSLRLFDPTKHVLTRMQKLTPPSDEKQIIHLPDLDSAGLEKGAHILLSDCWQINTCHTSFCRKNGLFVVGGDSNAGLCSGLLTHDNREWGIKECSFLGNTYLGCWADRCGHLESIGNYMGGSYTVGGIESPKISDSIQNSTLNYSAFLGCYTESGFYPDFTKAPSVSIWGNNLSGAFSRWDQLKNVNINFGANLRSGSEASKLSFKDEEYVVNPAIQKSYTTRELLIRIPNIAQRAALSFGYLPSLNNRQKFLKEKWDLDNSAILPGQPPLDPSHYWEYDTFLNADALSWHIQRGGTGYHSIDTPNSDGENSGNATFQSGVLRDDNRYDRTWVINKDDPTIGLLVPFGWTDSQHPLTGGHFFFGHSIANQPSYFTFKLQLRPQDLSKKINNIDIYTKIISASLSKPEFSVIQQYIINMPENLKFMATFSLEASNAANTDTAFVIAEHSYLKGTYTRDPKFIVKIVNFGSNPHPLPVPNLEWYLNVHIECFELWPDKRFAGNTPWEIVIAKDRFLPETLANVKRGTKIMWFNTDDTTDVKHKIVVQQLPNPMKIFESGDLLFNDHVSFVVNNPGIYDYHCAYHPLISGKIVVV